MRPLLVTGATGWLGRRLVAGLRQDGLDPVTTARSESGTDEPGHDLAVDAATLLEKVVPGAILHLAGATGGDAPRLYRDNVVATVNLVNAAALLDPPPFVVVVGSAAEYGEGAALDEQAPLKPVTEYGRSKALQSTLVREISARKNVPVTIVRPFNLVAGDLPDAVALGRIRLQLCNADSGRPDISCGRLDLVRDFVGVDVFSSAIRTILSSPNPPPVLNVCTGVGIRLDEVLFAMAEQLGLQPRWVPDPSLVEMPAAREVVGDASLLGGLVDLEVPTPSSVARLVLGG